MMKDNKFFDDMAKIASGAAGNIMEMKREIESIVNVQIEKLLQKINLGTREELETLHAMIAKCREEQEELKARVDALEKAAHKHP